MQSLLGRPINSEKVLGVFAKLRKAAISFVMSVHQSVRLSVLMELCSHLRIFMKFDI
jgi:hypothetical protein